jgi:hypothetical protein
MSGLLQSGDPVDDEASVVGGEVGEQPFEEVASGLLESTRSAAAGRREAEEVAASILRVDGSFDDTTRGELVDEATDGALLQSKRVGELLLCDRALRVELAEGVGLADRHRLPARGRVGTQQAQSAYDTDEGGLELLCLTT